jgi:hypothetical protein
MGGGMPRYAKVHYCTHTHTTHFGKTAGKLVPVTNPTLPSGNAYPILIQIYLAIE